MKQYLDLLQDVLDNGVVKHDRTGVGTVSVFGRQVRYDLQQGFPLVTTKKVHTKSIIHELLWFLLGSTNTKYLEDNGVTIWREWQDEKGELGPVYGKQWRSWAKYEEDGTGYASTDGAVDQIAQVIHQLKTNPDSRRIIVSAWNVAEIDQMRLPPCHLLFQFYTRPLKIGDRFQLREQILGEGFITIPGKAELGDFIKILDEEGIPKYYLDCQLYQRSADLFLGVPFNIASYALLIHMMAQQTNMVPGEFIHTLGDAHIYSNHVEQVKEQLSREPRPLPQLEIKRKPSSIFDYQFDDFLIHNYNPHPSIKAPVAV